MLEEVRRVGLVGRSALRVGRRLLGEAATLSAHEATTGLASFLKLDFRIATDLHIMLHFCMTDERLTSVRNSPRELSSAKLKQSFSSFFRPTCTLCLFSTPNPPGDLGICHIRVSHMFEC